MHVSSFFYLPSPYDTYEVSPDCNCNPWSSWLLAFWPQIRAALKARKQETTTRVTAVLGSVKRYEQRAEQQSPAERELFSLFHSSDPEDFHRLRCLLESSVPVNP